MHTQRSDQNLQYFKCFDARYPLPQRLKNATGPLCPRRRQGLPEPPVPTGHKDQDDLFDTAAIRLETPMRRNQVDFAPFNPVLRKARKRIETLFSQLCGQFMVRRNYAKSFQGLSTRILSKLTALTLIQWLNQRNGNKLNNLKIVIA